MNLSEARISKNVTQEQLAQATGFSQSMISHVEHGRYTLTPTDRERIEQELQLKIDWPEPEGALQK